jgi:hypothetical protein
MKALAALLLALPLIAPAADKPVDAGPYVPSPESVVADMLRYAEVGPKDFVIDLGSGDGRIVRTAALVFGARGFGVEIKDELIKKSNEEAKKEGIVDRVKFIKQDLFKTDISQATVVTMYLLPHTVNMLKNKLLTELRPGTRIVSHDYPLSGWVPEKTVQMELEDKIKISGVTTTLIFLYKVPAKVEGRWTAKVPANIGKGPLVLNLKQQITRVSGNALQDGKEVVLDDLRLHGETIVFGIAGRKVAFTGQVDGTSISGEVEVNGVKAPWSANLVK